MKQITIEIQNFDLADKFCEDFNYNNDIISEECGTEDNPYIDLLTKPYDDKTLREVWAHIKTLLNKNKALAKVTIVCCQGNNGWDDYQLLHHFDKTHRIDTL